jgi:hypothetical protein
MTEKIHREIEGLLRSYNLFYDRRKNQYKNEGKPIARMIQPLALAQTIISIILQRPDDARARPTTTLINQYDAVFNTDHPLPFFVQCSLLYKKVEGFLSSKDIAITRNDRSNLRWYLVMDYARRLTGKPSPSVGDIEKIAIPLDDELLKSAHKTVDCFYRSLGANDEVAKGSEFVAQLKGAV